ncbi:MAG: hypothetical protein AVDCRST_MAG76-1622 [uncultured Acidimicrobiales bacterium]|uniref:Uncharacterized protein n=1 Tax=uncultured Acidimicrobiales bacterium TaxID=310071 RepID=A0A6J4I2D9_9ACTN|nr:MAG: hypothetical protein AVDCRST_MAG76-1622 [uncultured Acidimicrobiales bacterium]
MQLCSGLGDDGLDMSTSTRPPVGQLPPGRPSRGRERLRGLITRRRVVSSLALAIAAALLVIGFQESQDGGVELRQSRPASIIRVFPTEGSSSLRQEPIGAQLADEFTGELEVDGRAIPLDQLEKPPAAAGDNAPAARGLTGLNQVSFTPGPGKDIESLAPGGHTARLLFWRKVGETRAQAVPYTWSFTAS